MIYPYLFGSSSVVSFDIGGQIFPFELILIGLALVYLKKLNYKNGVDKDVRKFIFLGLLYLISQIITDMIREISLEDRLKGVSTIIFLVVGSVALRIFIGNDEKTLFRIFIGAQIGLIGFSVSSPDMQELGNPWKWGVGSAVAYILAMGGGKFYEKSESSGRAVGIVIILFAAFLFSQNARSVGGAIFAAGVLVWGSKRYPSLTRNLAKKMQRPRNLLFGLPLIGLSFFLFVSLITQIGLAGYFGEEAQKKYEIQAQGEYGVLLAGRNELIFSSQAIADSPIIGHGSWAKDPQYRQLYWKLYDFRYVDDDIGKIKEMIYANDLIPVHSHIFGGWVWAGFLGAVFWMWIIIFLWKVLLQSIVLRHRYVPVLSITVLLGTWNIFFSPFGAGTRVQWEIFMAMLFFVNYMNKRLIAEKKQQSF